MKKALLIAGILAITAAPISIGVNTFAKTTPTKAVQSQSDIKPQQPSCDRHREPAPEEMKRRADFEKKLKLTDAQKAQAKIIREKGRTEIHPIMEKIKEIHQQIHIIKNN